MAWFITRVDPNAERPIYSQIKDEVRRGIAIGALQPDQALPSTRQLAAHLRINHLTVQQAYAELEREGVVYFRRGLGTFVAAGVKVDTQREALAREVARRALRDAYRYGLNSRQLLQAIKAEAGDDDDVVASRRTHDARR
jgi:GntR family transcriptional regulator